jgi:hypothetical protein
MSMRSGNVRYSARQIVRGGVLRAVIMDLFAASIPVVMRR